MNSLDLSRTLDQLCHAERRSLLPRLQESTVFVSWPSAEQADAVQEMIQEEQEHIAWLIEMINDLGESSTPCTADVRTTSIHYVELDYLMPRVIQSKRDVIEFYEQNAAAVWSSPAASELISRIIARHKAQLAKLEAVSGELESAPTEGGV